MAVSGRKSISISTSVKSDLSEKDVSLLCQPCRRIRYTQASWGYCRDCEEYLCRSCFDSHRSIKPCRHHTLIVQNSMPKNERLSLSLAVETQLSCYPKKINECSKHSRKKIELYCHDHDALLCNVCVSLNHSPSSCKLDYIPEISTEIVSDKEYSDTIENADDLFTQCQVLKIETRKEIESSNRSLTNILKEIYDYRKELNRKLDELEKGVVDKAKNFQDENQKRLKSTEKTCDFVSESLKSLHETATQLKTSCRRDILFIHMKTAEKEIEAHKQSLSKLMQMENVAEYIFEPNRNIYKKLSNEQELGILRQMSAAHLQDGHISTEEISFDEQTLDEQASAPATSVQPVNLGELCIKTSDDEKDCCITGMCLLTHGCLCLADNANKAIKMVDTNSNHVASRMSLSYLPWDITSVTDKELAVTLPDKHRIQFLSVSPRGMKKKKRKLKVDGQCTSIHYYMQKFVVTYVEPSKFQILGSKGGVLTTVVNSSRDGDLFHLPLYVRANKTSIYVSDSKEGESSIVMFNWLGEIIGTFKGVEWSAGLSLKNDGSVFLCDKALNSIQKMKEDCSESEIVLKDLENPLSVCWCDKKLTLCVCFGQSAENNANFLKFYEIS